MNQIISFNIDGKSARYFWTGNIKLPKEMNLSDSEISVNGKTAKFYVMDGFFYKFIRSKKKNSFFKRLSENIDKLLFLTPASKEARGNKLLKEIGLPVAIFWGIGIPLSPFSPFKCLYVQEFLSDAVTLGDYLKQDVPQAIKKKVLDNVFNDILQMYKHQLSYRYMAPKDIMVDSKNDIYWIDTRVKQIEKNKEFKRQFRKHLFNLLRYMPENSIDKKQILQFNEYIDWQNSTIQKILVKD